MVIFGLKCNGIRLAGKSIAIVGFLLRVRGSQSIQSVKE